MTTGEVEKVLQGIAGAAERILAAQHRLRGVERVKHHAAALPSSTTTWRRAGVLAVRIANRE